MHVRQVVDATAARDPAKPAPPPQSTAPFSVAALLAAGGGGRSPRGEALLEHDAVFAWRPPAAAGRAAGAGEVGEAVEEALDEEFGEVVAEVPLPYTILYYTILYATMRYTTSYCTLLYYTSYYTILYALRGHGEVAEKATVDCGGRMKSEGRPQWTAGAAAKGNRPRATGIRLPAGGQGPQGRRGTLAGYES